MRYGFDRLAQVERERVGQDPVEGGALFVFPGKSGTRLKVLWFEWKRAVPALQTTVFTLHLRRLWVRILVPAA